jgi:uncharacterized damage-inducible protein DinB
VKDYGLNESLPPESDSVARAFVRSALDFLAGEYLPKIERCLEQLDDHQIWWRANPESNSVGNLVLHLCGNARQWIIAGLGGEPDKRRRDAEFAQTDVIPRRELLEILRTTLAEVEAVMTALDPETLLEKRLIQGKEVEVLHALFHVTEHFSMHTGQIILLTKLLAKTDLRFYDFSNGVPLHCWSDHERNS